MAQILFSRGIISEDAFSALKNPVCSESDDPFLLPDMDKAVSEICETIERKEKICIYGDYDVDGISATVILFKTLKNYTDNIIWYIPSRLTEGYGLQKEAIRKIYKSGAKLIITVDNGISAVSEAEFIYSLGMRLVITDHHRFSGTLPRAEAVVASSRDGYAEKINDLSGAGVSWMLCRALTGAPLNEWLPFVGLAIAADSVRVTQLNRVYLKESFDAFQNEKHFRQLLSAANALNQPVSMYTLNFIIAPRINAAGRMRHADIAVRFFLSEDEEEIRQLAALLDKLNQERKAEEVRIFDACCASADLNPDDEVLVFSGTDWNPGVIGITASKLSEKFHKNVFVLSKRSDGTYTGSARSDGITDLYALLLPCAPLLQHFGGHAGAAGLTIAEDKIPALKKALQRSFRSFFPKGLPEPEEMYDVSVEISDCTVELVKELQILQPYGPGNPEPVFRFPFVNLQQVTLMGKTGAHLSAQMTNGKSTMRLIYFLGGEYYPEWMRIRYADVLATLNINTFGGRSSCEAVCANLMDGNYYANASKLKELYDAFSMNLLYNKTRSLQSAKELIYFIGSRPLSETALREMYLLLKRRFELNSVEMSCLSPGTKAEAMALAVFAEMGLVNFTEDRPCFTVSKTKKCCSDSILFQILNINEGEHDNNGTEPTDSQHS